MKVSVCIVAYNEEDYLEDLLKCINRQTYDHKLMEILLIDSMSTDRTLEIMQSFVEDDLFYNVRILMNPRQIQAAGWNIAIDNFSGEVMIRLDAHATVPDDFVERNIHNLKTEDVSGGQRPCIVERTTPWKSTLLIAENALFGSGIAPFRRDTGKHYVKTMFHPAYKREVFDRVGHFDEKLLRTEDNDMNYRIRKAGYKLFYDPEIISYQHIRNNLRRLVKQKYRNGYWVGLTLGYQPKCLSIYHLIPFAFVIAIICSITLVSIEITLPMYLLIGTYSAVNILMSLVAVLHEKTSIFFIALPFLFLLLHLSYGIGSLIGLIYLPVWRLK